MEIVDEMGIDGLSLRELAKRQNVTEGALYKHFSSKEEILLAILGYYAQYDALIMNTIKSNNSAPKEGIKFFSRSLAEIFQSHPAMTCIVNSFEVLLVNSPSVKRVKEIFAARSAFIEGLVEDGQRDGSISGEFNADYLVDLIQGLIRISALKWRMSGCSFSLKERVESSLDLLLSKF